MKKINFYKRKIIRKLELIKIIKKSEKKIPIFKKVLKNKKINIYDIGAGQRILNELIFFDSISNIYLIDPNKNLDYSYNKLSKIFKDKKSIKKFDLGLSDKTGKLDYYNHKISSSSSFAITKKNIKEKKIDKFYKINKKQVYSFEKFKSKYKLNKPDIVKIDTEGYELKILNSILKKNYPLIIQVETNLNSHFFDKTFLDIQNLLNKKKYSLVTLIPHYGYYDLRNKSFNSTNNRINLYDTEFNTDKTSTAQVECYFLRNKKNYNIKDVVSLSAYGFKEILVNFFNNNDINKDKTIKEALSQILN